MTAGYTHGYTPIDGIGSMVAANRTASGATYYQYPVYDHRGTVVRLTDGLGPQGQDGVLIKCCVPGIALNLSWGYEVPRPLGRTPLEQSALDAMSGRGLQFDPITGRQIMQ